MTSPSSYPSERQPRALSTTSRGPTLRRVLLGSVTVLSVVGLVLTSCSGSGTSGGNADSPSSTEPALNAVGAQKFGPEDTKPTKGGKITYGIDGEPEGLDPTRYAFTQAGHAVASAVYDPLATLDENGNAVPYLAKAFEPNADYTQWTIVLPEGVKFHDDTPLDASAVMAALEAHRQAPITGPTAKAQIASMSAPDATHVVIKTPQPIRSFPLLFTTQIGYVPAPVMLNSTEYVKKPIGSGPFVFESQVPGKSWSFKRNPNYRQADLPYLDAIEFQSVADNAERNAKLRKGDLDVIQTYTGPQIAELRAFTDFKRVENRHGDKSMFMVNTTEAPFDKLIARRALALATDSAKWRKDIHADVATPANSPYGPGQPGYLADNGFPTYNLDEAKKAVAQYKTETGKDLEFTLLAASDPVSAGMAQTFADQFGQADMKVTVQQLPQINLLASAAAGKYQLTQFRLFSSPNPDTDVNYYRASSIVPNGISINFPRYTSPVIEKGIADAIATDDVAKRKAAYESISRDMGQNLPFIWLGQNTWVVSASPRVNGIYGAMNGSIPIVGPKTWIHSLSILR